MEKTARVITPFKNLSKKTKTEFTIAYCLEGLLSLTGIALVIYYSIINDPSHRLWSSVGVVAAGIIPFAVERLMRKRISFPMHIVFFVHLTCSALFGGALMFHNTVYTYDKIMHFLLGIWCCAYMMCFMKSIDDLKPWVAAFAFFMMSMGLAALWECVIEFSMDVFTGQTALGFLSPEAQKLITDSGLKGVAANYESLKYIGVWDTLMDMMSHMFGSLLFCILYLLNRKKGYNLGVGYFRDKYRSDEANISSAEACAEVSIRTQEIGKVNDKIN